MRRSVIAARSSAGPLVRAAVYQQHMPRRMFATGGTPGGTPPPSKSEPPTTPVDRSKDQAHPIGAYYEGVLNGSKNYPDTKPELPPVTSQKYPAKLKPAESEAKPEPEPSKPKQDDNAQGTSPQSQSQADPTPASNPSSNLSGSDGSGTTPAPQESQQNAGSEDEGEAGSTKIIFSASLASAAQRAERLASIRAQSKLVAGVLVPPRPEEPDNCCMSGCVNCVWDLYRDEMEAWATATAEAEQRLAAQDAGLGEEGAVAVTGAVEAGGSQQTPSSSSAAAPTSEAAASENVKKGTELGGTAHSVVDQRGAVSMDDDGGGSSSNWDFGTAQTPATGAAGAASGAKTSAATDTTWNDDLYKNVPVGIREFMKQEKRLKEKHAREGTVG
ncbi:oxidoreductase-like protein [Sordaria brevicollis]|uniref:Oxidoreductase-like protein n=1 Tax=Sordaria brevicollis TaxID=83679 RepID=A0AAE0UFT9_SORBR|nr:oxidoreductase-like protein [Sordaria brevicollis]